MPNREKKKGHTSNSAVMSSSTDDDDDDFLGFSRSDRSDEDTLACYECGDLATDKASYKDVERMMKLGMRWHCFSCLKKPKNKSKDPTNALLLEMIIQLKARVDNLEKRSSNVFNDKSTEEVNNKQMKDRTTHQVIVSVKNKQDLTEETFAEKVKSNLSTVPIVGIKVAKGGQGIINFPDKSSRDVGLSKLVNDFEAEANNRPQRVLLPKITIFGIRSSDYKDTDAAKLKQAICDKNPSLKALIDAGKCFDILFIKNDWRRTDYSYAAVKVDKDVYDEIKKLDNRIYIDFTRCHISDRLRVIQCYRCQEFGHVSNNCPAKSQICRYCGECHNAKNCPVKANTNKYKCINCKGHHATNSIKCPTLLSQVDNLMKKTQGMESTTKNDIRPSAIVT